MTHSVYKCGLQRIQPLKLGHSMCLCCCCHTIITVSCQTRNTCYGCVFEFLLTYGMKVIWECFYWNRNWIFQILCWQWARTDEHGVHYTAEVKYIPSLNINVDVPRFHSGITGNVISVVAVGSGAPERAPQVAVDPGSSCCTAPGHCCGTGDHQGCTGPSAATEDQQGSGTSTPFKLSLVYITLHLNNWTKES